MKGRILSGWVGTILTSTPLLIGSLTGLALPAGAQIDSGPTRPAQIDSGPTRPAQTDPEQRDFAERKGEAQTDPMRRDSAGRRRPAQTVPGQQEPVRKDSARRVPGQEASAWNAPVRGGFAPEESAREGVVREEPLTLSRLLETVRERNPRLQAAAHDVEAFRAREPGAGLLPDPALRIGVANLALPDLGTDMPASMAPTIHASQRIPLPGKLSLRGRIARESTAVEEAAARDLWWQVRAEAAQAFYTLYRMESQLEVKRETLSLLRDFQRVARSRYTAGTGPQADVLRASVEVARMDADMERDRAVRKAVAARLNALMNRPSGTVVPSPVLGALPAETPSPDELRMWARESRPLLKEVRTEVARAASRRVLAHKEIWPDVTVGLQYGVGWMNGDARSMGGATVGFSLPVHAGKRQLRARDEAAAEERAARARLQEALSFVDARIREILAEVQKARTLLALYREEIIPQALATVESSFASYRVGAVDFGTLVDAQKAVNRFQTEYHTLLAAYGTALAHLEMTVGRDLPVAAPLTVEVMVEVRDR